MFQYLSSLLVKSVCDKIRQKAFSNNLGAYCTLSIINQIVVTSKSTHLLLTKLL